VFGPELSHILLAAVVTVSILLMLVRPRNTPEVWWIGGGVLLLLVLRLVPLSLAGRAAAKGTDVYLFLAGMMLLSELAREHGVFDWLSSIAVRGAKGSYSRLFLLVYAVGTVVTIFMSNDATAVVLTPAILVAVRRAKVNPLPYLFCLCIHCQRGVFRSSDFQPSKSGGVPRSDACPGAMAIVVRSSIGLSIVVTFVMIRWIFGKELRGRIECIRSRVRSTTTESWFWAGWQRW